MNLIRVCGGLGNQFFQYALGRAMRAEGIEVQYDLTWYSRKTDPPRPFRLNMYNTDIISGVRVRGSRKGLIQEKGRTFQPDLIKKDGFVVRGYWQTTRYHKGIQDILRNEFQLKEEFYTEEFLRLRRQIIDSEAVGIHVRRQDFAKAGVVMLPAIYYDNALALIGKKKIFVFSDDIEWCEDVFCKYKDITFVNLEDYLDFELLKSCPYKIIANSTFSWWAAHLGEESQVVYRPDNWKTWVNGVEQKEYDMEYSPNWIAI